MCPDATIGDRCPPFLRPFARAATLDSANVEVDFPSKEVCSRVFLSKRIKKEVSGFQDPQGDQGVLKSGKPGCSFWIPCHSAGGNNPEIALFASIGAQTSRMSSFFKFLRRPDGMKPKMRNPISGLWHPPEIRKTGMLILDPMPFGRREQSRNRAIRQHWCANEPNE